VAGSYPPRAYLPYAVLWGAGGTAACAVADARISGWLPDAGVAVSCLTLVVDLLLMRALDDLRDLDYDRVHNPGRPLARGAVSRRDLGVLIAAGSVFILAVNAWRWPVMCVLAGQLGYALAVLWADRRLRWPPGDALLLGLGVSFPVQLLINGYLYSGLLYSAGLGPSWSGAAGIAVSALAFGHLEFARKTTRRPRPGERSYVTLFGASGTAALGVSCAVASVVLLIATAAGTRAGAGAGTGAGGTVAAACWLAAAPLAFVVSGAVRFWRRREPRWPYGMAALFLLTSFAAYQVIGLIAKVARS
jgi:hypothetical protein